MSSTMVTSSTQTLRRRERGQGRAGGNSTSDRDMSRGLGMRLTPRRAGCGFRFGRILRAPGICPLLLALACGSRLRRACESRTVRCFAARHPSMKNDAVVKSGRSSVFGSDMAFSRSLSAAPTMPRRRVLLGAALGAGCFWSARAAPPSPNDTMAAAELKRAAERADLCSASNATGSGLRGEYFAKDPVASAPLLVRVDPTIDFDPTLDWPANLAGRRPSAVRWTGWVKPPYAGSYRFHVEQRARARGRRAPGPRRQRRRHGSADPSRRRTGSIRSISTSAGSMGWPAD